ncbi:LuxR C-terminal-related transcriptional regulator [Streptomyces sp. NBC_00105]|uniref:helix-turn-helix transcriptional regulator n=1 Tax=unclassified Streptomyces TaxID=2593676 RepID=UPI00324C99E0
MTHVLAERDDVLLAAAAAAARARTGRGSWLMLAAPPGRGRSAVLDTVVRRAGSDHGVRVLSARCSPEETAFPFALVRQVFPGADGIPFTDPAAEQEQELFHRLLDLLTRTAAVRPVLLAVDDLHCADPVSRRWIGYLARRIAGLPILLLATECREHSDVTWLPRTTGACHPLPPLGQDAVTRLARERGLAPEQRATLRDATAGNPALVQALLTDLADSARSPDPGAGHASDPPGGVPPARYRDALARWIRHRADDEARHIALALAITARCSPATGSALLQEALTLCPARHAAAPCAPRLARLLSHPLALAAVLDAADPTELAGLHTRAARLLHDRGAPAAAVAAHLLHLERPRARWMARCLEEAADDAVRAGHTEEAAGLLRHALRTQPPPARDRHADLTMRLGSLEFPQSAAAGIRRLRTGLDLHPDRRERAAAAPALGAALAARGRTDSALGVLHRASSGADDDELVHVLQTVAALISSHDAVAWRDAVAGLRTLAPTASPAVEPLVCGLIAEYETGAGLLSAAEVLDRIQPRLTGAPVHPRLRTAWLGSAATLLQWADRLDDARALARQGLPVPPTPPDLTDAGLQCLLSARAEAALWAGDFRSVIAENTLLAHTCTGRGIRAPHLVSMVALARYELGLRDQAWQLLSTPDETTADSSWEWNELRYARALLHGFEGRWQAALDDHLACGTGQSARDFVSPVATPWRSGAALALVRLGRAGEARELAEEELRHARRWGTPRTVGRALRAHAAAVGGRQGLESLTEAAALLEGAPAPVERVEILIDLGRARIGAGLGRRGRDDLRVADAEAARLLSPAGAGVGPWAGDRPGDRGADPAAVPTGRLLRATSAALRDANARTTTRARTGPGALTGAERRVVDLAAEGHTNAQIGEALHLSRRTVETHLTSSYRKLQVTRRSQLAAGLAGTDTAGGGPRD